MCVPCSECVDGAGRRVDLGAVVRDTSAVNVKLPEEQGHGRVGRQDDLNLREGMRQPDAQGVRCGPKMRQEN